MNSTVLFQEIIRQSILRFNENCLRIERCLESIADEEIWYRSNENSNSIANLILHLTGNIKQYIISGLGNDSDIRSRDLEFSQRGGMTKAELSAEILETCIKAQEVIKALKPEEIMEYRSVQGFKLTTFGILLHVIEHFSYHTGQIAAITKALRNEDLGFYSGFDLNVKNVPQ